MLAPPARAADANALDPAAGKPNVAPSTGQILAPSAPRAGGNRSGSGEVIVGSSGAPCTAPFEGAIRYADKKLQFCDGTGWRVLSVTPNSP